MQVAGLLLSLAIGGACGGSSDSSDGGVDACSVDCGDANIWVPQFLGTIYDVGSDGSLVFGGSSATPSVLFPNGSGWSASVAINSAATPISNQAISADAKTLAIKGSNNVIGGAEATYFFADRSGALERAIPPGTVLSRDALFYRAPRLSSDGKRMFFSDVEQIWVVDRGSAPRTIGEKVLGNGVWWISDAGDFALTSVENNVVGPSFPMTLHNVNEGSIEIIDLVDAQGASLTIPEGVRSVFLSPNRRTLLFGWSSNGKFGAELYDRDSKNIRSLMTGLDDALYELGGNLASVSMFDVTPDLRYLAAAANVVNQSAGSFGIVAARLYIVDIESGAVYNASSVSNPFEQRSGATYLREISLRPDGQQVFFNNDYIDSQSMLKSVAQRTELSSWERLEL